VVDQLVDWWTILLSLNPVVDQPKWSTNFAMATNAPQLVTVRKLPQIIAQITHELHPTALASTNSNSATSTNSNSTASSITTPSSNSTSNNSNSTASSITTPSSNSTSTNSNSTSSSITTPYQLNACLNNALIHDSFAYLQQRCPYMMYLLLAMQVLTYLKQILHLDVSLRVLHHKMSAWAKEDSGQKYVTPLFVPCGPVNGRKRPFLSSFDFITFFKLMVNLWLEQHEGMVVLTEFVEPQLVNFMWELDAFFKLTRENPKHDIVIKLELLRWYAFIGECTYLDQLRPQVQMLLLEHAIREVAQGQQNTNVQELLLPAFAYLENEHGIYFLKQGLVVSKWLNNPIPVGDRKMNGETREERQTRTQQRVEIFWGQRRQSQLAASYTQFLAADLPLSQGTRILQIQSLGTFCGLWVRPDATGSGAFFVAFMPQTPYMHTYPRINNDLLQSFVPDMQLFKINQVNVMFTPFNAIVELMQLLDYTHPQYFEWMPVVPLDPNAWMTVGIVPEQVDKRRQSTRSKSSSSSITGIKKSKNERERNEKRKRT
jgi:hypothetical protein